MKTRLCLIVASTVVALGPAVSAFGQFPRYVPPGGNPLPSQLDYFRRDVGVLDPYNQFVRPRRELNSRLRMIERQEFVDRQVTQQVISGLRASQAAPTGSGATFMNYSHYYQQSAGGYRRR